MNAARILPKIDEMIAQLKQLREQVEGERDDSAPDPIYLDPKRYAQRAGVSLATVKRWMGMGLPVMRRGRVVRVKVAEADRWNPSEAIDKSADHAAHRGDR